MNVNRMHLPSEKRAPTNLNPAHAAVLGYLIVLAFLIPWFPASDKVPFGIETVGQETAWHSSVFQGVKSCKWEYFSPEILAGYPLLAETEAFPLYPFKAAFFFFPANQALSITLLVHFLLLFHGTFLLSYTYAKSIAGALTTGLIAVFCGPLFGTVLGGHLSEFAAFTWLPWIAWAWYRALRNNSLLFGVLGGLFILISLAAGHIQFSIMAVVGAFILAYTASRRPRQRLTAQLPTALFITCTGLAAFACAAFWLWPLSELVDFSNRADGFDPLLLHLQSLHFHQLITALAPNVFGNTATSPYVGLLIYSETTCFVGVFPVLLILAGASLRDPRDRAALVLLIFGIAMALSLIIVPLASIVTPLSSFQLPIRWRLLAGFATAVLAGQSVSRILSGEIGQQRILFAGSVVFVILTLIFVLLFPMKGWKSLLSEASSEFFFGIRKGLLIGEALLDPASLVALQDHATRSVGQAFLFSFLGTVVLLVITRVKTGRIWPSFCICAVIVFSLGIVIKPLIQNIRWSQCGWPASFVNYLQDREGPFRVQTEIPFERSLAPFPTPYQEAFSRFYRYDKTAQDWGLLAGIESTSSGFSIIPQSYQRLTGIFWSDIQVPDKTSRRRLNVQYVMAPVSAPPEGVEPVPLLTKDDLGLFEDKNPLPRVSFFVDWTTDASVACDTLPVLSDPEGGPVPRPSAHREKASKNMPIPLAYSRESGPKFSTTKNMEYPGIVLFSELYYPGFEAHINGKRSKVFLAWGGLMAVNVPAGHHRISIKYNPDVWRKGAHMTFAGLFAFVLFTLYAWRHDKRQSG